MPLPRLIVVSGPAGAGKTTLAHIIAGRVGCPAICRDEIKEGMVLTRVGYRPRPGDFLNKLTYTTFVDVLRLLVRSGVSVVAEAAFQGPAWHLGLEPLAADADIRVIRCRVDEAVGRARRDARDLDNAVRNAAHSAPDARVGGADWRGISLDVPMLDVDTSEGYRPGVERVVGFCT